MPALATELHANAAAILDTLMRRAPDELKGTLYEEMNKQKILRARYSNVLDVITEYAAHPDVDLFRQHHIIIFMQRYYLDIDPGNPLTPRLIKWRTREINRSVDLYLDVLKHLTAAEHHAELDTMFATVHQLVREMDAFLLAHIARLKDRIPRVKMLGIDYGPNSSFDIDPAHWPEAGPVIAP